MRCLALESSSIVAGAALMEEDRVVGEIRTHYKKNHSERLLPMVDQLLTSCQCTLREVDFFAANIGPGSFTGIRIGVSTVKGLAQALQKPVVAVDSLESLAVQTPYFSGWCAPMIDAQKNLIYTAAYSFEDGKKSIQQAPDVFHLLEWLEMLKKTGISVLFSGDAAAMHRSRIVEILGAQAHFTTALHRMPTAAAVAQCAMEKAMLKELISPKEMIPLYLRTSQAERAWRQKQIEEKGFDS